MLSCSANGTYFNNRPANGGGCKPSPFALIVLEAVPVQRLGFSVAEPHETRSGSDAADGVERRAEADAEISGEAFGGLRRGTSGGKNGGRRPKEIGTDLARYKKRHGTPLRAPGI